jgi:hypothetical protein
MREWSSFTTQVVTKSYGLEEENDEDEYDESLVWDFDDADSDAV